MFLTDQPCFDKILDGSPGGTMLAVTNGLGLDAVQVVHVRSCGDQDKDRQHTAADEDEYG